MAGSTYVGIGDAFSRIVREEGWRALFKGVQPRMLVQAPLFGITLGAFELQKRFYIKQMNAAMGGGGGSSHSAKENINEARYSALAGSLSKR